MAQMVMDSTFLEQAALLKEKVRAQVAATHAWMLITIPMLSKPWRFSTELRLTPRRACSSHARLQMKTKGMLEMTQEEAATKIQKVPSCR